MASAKERVYRTNSKKTCVCEYKVWDRTKKRLVDCGAAARQLTCNNRHVAYLCQEHAAFYVDAHNATIKEEL